MICYLPSVLDLSFPSSTMIQPHGSSLLFQDARHVFALWSCSVPSAWNVLLPFDVPRLSFPLLCLILHPTPALPFFFLIPMEFNVCCITSYASHYTPSLLCGQRALLCSLMYAESPQTDTQIPAEYMSCKAERD